MCNAFSPGWFETFDAVKTFERVDPGSNPAQEDAVPDSIQHKVHFSSQNNHLNRYPFVDFHLHREKFGVDVQHKRTSNGMMRSSDDDSADVSSVTDDDPTQRMLRQAAAVREQETRLVKQLHARLDTPLARSLRSKIERKRGMHGEALCIDSA